MATRTQATKEVVQRGFDAINDRDRETFVETHVVDTELHFGGEDIRGIDKIADVEFAYFDAFPDLTVSPDDVVAEGDTVVVRWTITGMHEGEFEAIEPTGEAVEYEAMGTFRVEDGKISEVWLVADRLGMLQQLDVVDSPSSRLTDDHSYWPQKDTRQQWNRTTRNSPDAGTKKSGESGT